MMHAGIELSSARDWPAGAAQQESVNEELANSLTHGLGLLLSIAGAVVLIASLPGSDTPLFLGGTVYAFSLIAVYAASFLSHAVQTPSRKRLFRALDQGLIYLLIAGTYTPYALVYLGAEWWLLTAAMWAVALLGFASKVLARHRIDSVSVALYLTLGWLPVIAAGPLLERVPPTGIGWIVAGGLAYTVGTAFLCLDTRFRYFHAVWHVLVIKGSACHFAGILWYVVPFARP